MINSPQLKRRLAGVLLGVAVAFSQTGIVSTLAHDWIENYEGAQTCLGCHSSVAADLMASIHWTWEKTDSHTGNAVGKNNIINNYCIAIGSNEPRCTSCHIGIGYADKTFDFSDSSKLDCLICHDTTGTYSKVPTGAGAPPGDLDLLPIAQNVGLPDRDNCGACHFFGGGGDAVKHGDLDSTMANPTRDVDVHMGGMNFSCSRCHVPNSNEPHNIVGTRYSSDTTDDALCMRCHTNMADRHSGTITMHTARVACQTCHIPAYARGGKATKVWWDWTTAGEKNPEGGDLVIPDENGNPIYHTKKGSFKWEDNVIPEYRWFNGNVTFVTLDDQVSPDQTVSINTLHGNVDDPNARIFPVKRFAGKQPYDAGRGTLAVPHLFGADSDAFWKSYDWEKSLSAGSTYVGKDYVGPVGYVETEMFWIQNHMVAPKEQALTCTDCHVPRGRLNFAELGYPADRAIMLQTRYGFEIDEIQPTTSEGNFQLQWTGTPGNSYQVQVRDGLDAAWTDAPDGSRTVEGDAPVPFTWTDATPAGGTTPKLYRIVRN